MHILIEYDPPYEYQHQKPKPPVVSAPLSFLDRIREWIRRGRHTDNTEAKETKDADTKEPEILDPIKAYVTFDSPDSKDFYELKQTTEGELHMVDELQNTGDFQGIRDMMQKVLGTSGLVHLFSVRKSIALITRILPGRLDTIVEIVRAVRNWEKDVNIVLYTCSPDPGVDTQTLTDLFKAVDLTVVCDVKGLSDRAKEDAQRVISAFIDETLKGLDGIEPHSIGTISYNGIYMPQLNVEGSDLRPKLDEEFVFNKPIAWFAEKSIQHSRIFFSAPPNGEFRGEIEDLFVHEKLNPIQRIGNTQDRVDIIRFYHISNYDRGDIIDICLDSFDKGMDGTGKFWATD